MNFAEEYLKEVLPKGAWEYYLAKKAKEELEEAIKKRPTQCHGEAYPSYYKMQVRFIYNVFLHLFTALVPRKQAKIYRGMGRVWRSSIRVDRIQCQ